MNTIVIRGVIRNIRPSHVINNVEYYQGDVVVPRENLKEDVLPVKFKKCINKFTDGDEINIIGNIRSHSTQLDNGKNKVDVYVFTYQDIPDIDLYPLDINNEFILDGRVCKINPLRLSNSGKHNIQFILANNILVENSSKLNNYLPCCCWGKLALECESLKVNDKIQIIGELHSRTYKKQLDSGEIEIKVAHELFVKSLMKVEE